jgi:hypothetical protein
MSFVACSFSNEKIDKVDMDTVQQDLNVHYDDSLAVKETRVDTQLLVGDGFPASALELSGSKASISDNGVPLVEEKSLMQFHQRHTFPGRVLTHEFIFTAKDGVTRHTNRATMPTADFDPNPIALQFSLSAGGEFSFLGENEMPGDTLRLYVVQGNNSASFYAVTANRKVVLDPKIFTDNKIVPGKATCYWQRDHRFELTSKTPRGGAIYTFYTSEKKIITLIP